MKALMVLAFFLGVLAIFPWPQREREEVAASVVGQNYAVLRNAALLSVFSANPRPGDGDIPVQSLKLPSGWRALRPWKIRMDGGCCYIFGDASAEEIAAARELLRGSLAVGWAANGRLQPGGRTPLPNFIPAGSLVSVVAVE